MKRRTIPKKVKTGVSIHNKPPQPIAQTLRHSKHSKKQQKKKPGVRIRELLNMHVE